jgi:hypothetical protein
VSKPVPENSIPPEPRSLNLRSRLGASARAARTRSSRAEAGSSSGLFRQVFGMPTTLDPETQALIDERNTLIREKEKGANIKDELHRINAKLDALVGEFPLMRR